MSTKSLLSSLISTLFCAALVGCASYSGGGLAPGASQADVRAKMGEPAAVHKTAGPGYAEFWEYSRGLGGRDTFMVRFDAGGKMVRIDQVRTEATLRQIRVGVDDEKAVREMLGRPDRDAGPSRFYGGPIWDYYARVPGMRTIISVTFDRGGKVAAVGSMTDPDELGIAAGSGS